ncbi:MAG: pyrroloquinoline quinone biosynthesis peptide chaperone PqqD, partial [Pseudomonadota bacterium]
APAPVARELAAPASPGPAAASPTTSAQAAPSPARRPVPAVAAEAVPFLPRGVRLRFCTVRQDWFLLAPERAMKLDPIGAAILQALDGTRDFAAITAHLAAAYDAPVERIATDAGAFLAQMRARRMVETR